MPLTDSSDSLVTRNLTVEDSLALGSDTAVEFQEMTAPPTPSAGTVSTYAKTDGKLYAKNDAGVEFDLAGGTDASALVSGTLDGARLSARHKTLTKIVYIENPKASDSFPIAFIPDAVTLVQVRGVTDAGTADFNIEHRATDTPDVAGTDTLTSDLQAAASGASSTTFSDATVPAERWLNINLSAVSGSPTKLWAAVEYRIDD